MSIVFFGTPEFAAPSLLALLRTGEEISLVVTQPDKLKGRGHKLSSPPVKTTALAAGLKVAQPPALKDNYFQQGLCSLQPEFIIVVAYGKILPESILRIPKYCCINVHASLLPKYRGAAPIQWAIINGEKKTGVTTMVVTEKLDTGPLLLQQDTEIKDEDTQETLSKRLSEQGATLLTETLKGMRAGTVRPVPQKDDASYAPPLKKRDGLIDWSMSAEGIFNLVRGLYPWPGACCHIDNETIKLIKVLPFDGKGTPGVIAKAGKNELIVGTGRGLISIAEVQPAGKKPMPVSAFVQGRRLKEGDCIQ